MCLNCSQGSSSALARSPTLDEARRPTRRHLYEKGTRYQTFFAVFIFRRQRIHEYFLLFWRCCVRKFDWLFLKNPRLRSDETFDATEFARSRPVLAVASDYLDGMSSPSSRSPTVGTALTFINIAFSLLLYAILMFVKALARFCLLRAGSQVLAGFSTGVAGPRQTQVQGLDWRDQQSSLIKAREDSLIVGCWSNHKRFDCNSAIQNLSHGKNSPTASWGGARPAT